ncbi:MAG: Uma2 family endonuclease [Bacteroidota bacterium]
MTLQLQRLRLSISQYNKMIDAGILTENDKVELINGEIIQMSPIGHKHITTVNRLNMLFASQFAPEAIVSIQNPVQLGTYNEPEPDVVLIKGPFKRYKNRKPALEDVFVIIEVADSSLRFDREIKASMYAKENVPMYWIVNVEEDTVEVYTQPTPTGYIQCELSTVNDKIDISGLGQPVWVKDFLGEL